MTRSEMVEFYVSQGYSREFAEAHVPMTEREARARQLKIQQYESPYTTVNRAMARRKR